jgi:outer membrane protein TolC
MKYLILISTLLVAIPIVAQTPLTLEKCREMAIEHNQKIKQASLGKKAAAELRKSAFTQFLPNFNIEGSYSYLSKDFQLLNEDLLFPVVPYTTLGANGKVDASKLGPESIVINPATGKPVMDGNGNPVFKNYGWIPKDELSIDNNSIYLLNAGFVQPIFAGGKIRETYKIAGYAEEAAKSNEKLTVSEVLYNVESYYWMAVTLRQKVSLAGKYSEMLNALVADLESYHAEGLITKNDLLKAKVKQNEAKQMELKAQNGLSLAKMALFQQIGFPIDTLCELQDTIVFNPDLMDYHPSNLSFDSRAELSILDENSKIAKSTVNLMRSRYLPDIGLSAGYLLSNPNPYNGFSKEFGGTFAVGVVCKIPVFHWGDKNHTLNAAKAAYDISNLKLDEATELISLETKQAVYKFNESVKGVATAEITLQQATENLQVTQSEFEEGTIKTTELLEAQTLWQHAKTTLIEAQSELMLNQTLLKKVTGKLNNQTWTEN